VRGESGAEARANGEWPSERTYSRLVDQVGYARPKSSLVRMPVDFVVLAIRSVTVHVNNSFAFQRWYALISRASKIP
jgi:hypothetical protein